MTINLIDALLAVIVLLSALIGSRRGFVVAALQLLALAASLVLAFLGYGYVAGWLEGQVPRLGVWGLPLSFVATFIVCHLIFNPEGEDAFDRMRAAKLRYLTAGENLALAQTLAGAHQDLMNSAGHRANVLRPQFGRLGIGVLDAGRYGLMITQAYRN